MSAPNRSLTIKDAALSDLRSILAHTKQTWGDDQQAAYQTSISRAFARLLDNPRLGVARNDISLGLRSLLVERHKIFYRIEENDVIIVRILHQNMDARRHLS